MSVVRDIVATYRRPGAVFTRWIGDAPDEPRALVVAMAACGVIFLSQWPAAARQSFLTGSEMGPQIGAALLAWVFIAPLALYAIALISHLVLRIIGGKGGGFAYRMALFWALLAASPLWLLFGLTRGLIGEGNQTQVIGLLGFFAFVIFWAIGLKTAYLHKNKDDS